ncbi:hypothetical protein D9Q98_002251 [Chlorella vulgaris]|uniref:Mitochondrial carrier protein n=1 Tax=Chlorella vulgaris TaxID=3077 RepID=A0A9D4TW10_CHLVU|nr:hypothetical protein D9Q98_002251 [Chlorella vulgaris]
MNDRTAIDWNSLDKRRFFVVGTGLFTGLTTCLYPLSVVKTRQMALEGSQSGLKGAYLTARTVVAHDGLRGLYKGFGTVVFGMFPARMIYLSSLEISKSVTAKVLAPLNLSDTAAVGAASFIGGAMGSLSSQIIVVPIDVVAQRLMLLGGGPTAGADSTARAVAAAEAAQRQRTTGIHLARQIVRQEGLRGLYRGFGASLAMFVPNSAIWWGSYGVWQQLLWHQVDRWRGHHEHSGGDIVSVQMAAGVLTGCTSAALTNPLDVVKTRLQTAGSIGAAASMAAAESGAAASSKHRPTWRGVAVQLARQEGVAGFWRGVAPRMASSSIWGTAMVSSYEWLKRLCARPTDTPLA